MVDNLCAITIVVRFFIIFASASCIRASISESMLEVASSSTSRISGLRWIDVKNAYEFNKLINASKVEIIENAGHVPMEEQAGKFNSIIISFLEKI